jgi:hypothetical protein
MGGLAHTPGDWSRAQRAAAPTGLTAVWFACQYDYQNHSQ